ncbi:MAG: DUF1302 family protein [Candidatus Poribacteria bacterium]
MVKNGIIFSVFLTIILVTISAADISINGYIQTDNRLRLEDPKVWTWNENKLDMKLDAKPSEKIRAFGEIRLKGTGFSNASNISDLQDKSKRNALPYSLEMQEAYMDVSGFLTKKLDLRLGRQVIVWGTADKINPSSNLCPDDLEDIFNFGEKIGVNALKASFYQKIGETDLTLTGVFIPLFTPSTLPSSEWSKAFIGNFELPTGMKLASFSDKLILPENKPSEASSLGLKLSTSLLGYDLSFGYYNGYDKLPLVKTIFISPKDIESQTVDVIIHTSYPKIQAISADIVGEIASIGVWAEGAVFIPKETEMVETFLTPPRSLLKKSVALDDKPYFKYVIGGDYNFKHGFYLNMQYIHGFIHERGKNNLNDYFVQRLEYKFHNDEIKLVPISFAIGIDDWNNIKENYGLAYMPEIAYSPYDSFEMTLGAFILGGKGNGLFSKIKDNDEFFIRAKISF